MSQCNFCQESRVLSQSSPTLAEKRQFQSMQSFYGALGESAFGNTCFEVAFGLPWDHETFLARAVQLGHPTNFCKMLSKDIERAVGFHVSHSFDEIASERLTWCKTWLKRAGELDREEKQAASMRSEATFCSRLPALLWSPPFHEIPI